LSGAGSLRSFVLILCFLQGLSPPWEKQQLHGRTVKSLEGDNCSPSFWLALSRLQRITLPSLRYYLFCGGGQKTGAGGDLSIACWGLLGGTARYVLPRHFNPLRRM